MAEIATPPKRTKLQLFGDILFDKQSVKDIGGYQVPVNKPGLLSTIGRAMVGYSQGLQGRVIAPPEDQQQEITKFIIQKQLEQQQQQALISALTGENQSTPFGNSQPSPQDISSIPVPTPGEPMGPQQPINQMSMIGGLPSPQIGITGRTIGGVTIGQTPQSKMMMETAQEKNKEIQKQQLEAGQSMARDNAIFNMMGGIMGDLNKLYDQADKGGFAGDVYRSAIGDAITTGKVPKAFTDKANPEALAAVSGFVAARNELLTRMQPVLSEQFGKEGSSRIMESMLKLADRELGKLSDPKAAFVGKSKATLKNFYRFAKATQEYASRVGLTADAVTNLNEKELDKFVKNVWQSQSGKLSQEEDAQLEKVFSSVFASTEDIQKELKKRNK